MPHCLHDTGEDPEFLCCAMSQSPLIDSVAANWPSGMVAAARLSRKMGMLTESEVSRLKDLIEKAGLPSSLPDISVSKVIESMQHDKKVQHGRIRFILLRSLGDAFVTDEVSPALVEKVLNETT